MRKKLTPRDHEIIRRLFVGQSPKEISEDLGMSMQTIQRNVGDPLYGGELGRLGYEAERRITDSNERLDALQIIQDKAGRAAQLCTNVMEDPDMAVDLRMKSAWDILDRAGYKATEKRIVGVMSFSDLIIEAHRQSKEKVERSGATPLPE